MTVRKGTAAVAAARGGSATAAPRATRVRRTAGAPQAAVPPADSTSTPVVPGPRPVTQSARKRRPPFVF